MPRLGLGLGINRVRPLAAFSAEASDYFTRVEAAGGTVTAKPAVAAYIDSLVALGGAYWDTMGTSCLFVGVDFEGCFVPLRDGMNTPANFGFVSGDHNPATGLKGNGVKFILIGRSNNSSPQNDFSASTWIHTAQSSGNGAYFGSANASAGRTHFFQTDTELFFRNRSETPHVAFTITAKPTGFIGMRRLLSTEYETRQGGTNSTTSSVSEAPTSIPFGVFGRGQSGGTTADLISDARVSTYHEGPALDLSVLNGLQTTLTAAIL
jgi:hypothetical protein